MRRVVRSSVLLLGSVLSHSARLQTAASVVVISVEAPHWPATAQTPDPSADSARAFVQRFYDWYLPGENMNSAIRDRRSAFAPRLYQALKRDRDAQAKEPGDIVGLDFDPFTNSQDPCEHYGARGANRKGHGYEVEVVAKCGGKWNARPSAVALVERQGGKWVFANFIYADPDNDLLTILARLQKDREDTSGTTN